jgi:hypothetical protein
MSPRDLREKLPLFLDGALDPAEAAAVREALRRDAAAVAELDALRRTRSLLRARPPLDENPALASSIEQHLRSARPASPLPRIRYAPAALILGASVVVALAAIVLLRPSAVEHYLSRKGEQAQLAYEKTMKSDWIMPLFRKTDKDRVLNFAMYGTLPLDDGAQTVIQVDNSRKEGYKIELGKKEARVGNKVTAEDLYRELRATPSQRSVLDTLFLYAQRQLEEAVLMDTQEGMVVDPSIGRLNSTLLSGIAQTLEPVQRVRLEQYLTRNASQYAVIASAPEPPAPPALVYDRLRRVDGARSFVVMSGDTPRYMSLNMDLDSIRTRMSVTSEQLPSIAVRLQDISRRIGGVRIEEKKRMIRRIPAPSNREMNNEVITITVDSDGEEDGNVNQNIRVMVRPRNFPQHLPQFFAPPAPGRPAHIRVRVNDDEEGEINVNMEVNVDSILQRAFEAIPDFEIQNNTGIPPSLRITEPNSPRPPRPPIPGDTTRRKILRIGR